MSAGADIEVEVLRAENARMREALGKIADHFDQDGYGPDAWKNLALEMAEVARKALGRPDPLPAPGWEYDEKEGWKPPRSFP